MASIKPYKDGWRAQLYVLGVRDSDTFRLKRDAESWAARRKAEILAEMTTPAGERFSLRKMLERYRDEVSSAKRGSRWEMIRIDAFLRHPALPVDKMIGQVTTEDIGAWRDARSAEVKPGSVLREIGVLSAAFECARREWKWITINPLADMRKPGKPEHRKVTITRWQIRAQLRSMGHRRGPCKSASQAAARCFLLALRTGMRAGEITGLTWSRVMVDYCALPTTKTTSRNVPLEPKARRVIASMDGWDSEKVFGLSAQTLDALFRRYRDRAGQQGYTFHDSRHTAATWLAKRVDVLTLCKMFGWSDPKQAMVYYNPTASDIARMLVGKPEKSDISGIRRR